MMIQMLAGELKQTAARTDDLLKSCDHNLQQQQLLHKHHHQRWKANEWPLDGFDLALLSGDREGEEAEDGVAEEEEQTPVGRQESCVQFEVEREDGATLKRQQPSRTEPFEQLLLLSPRPLSVHSSIRDGQLDNQSIATISSSSQYGTTTTVMVSSSRVDHQFISDMSAAMSNVRSSRNHYRRWAPHTVH